MDEHEVLQWRHESDRQRRSTKAREIIYKNKTKRKTAMTTLYKTASQHDFSAMRRKGG